MRSSLDRTLLAVEPSLCNLFCLCPLTPGVSLAMLKALSSLQQTNRPQIGCFNHEVEDFDEDNWWQAISVRKTADKVSLEPHPSSRSETLGSPGGFQKSNDIASVELVGGLRENPVAAGDSLQHNSTESPEDFEKSFNTIRSQYQEALYTSKVGHILLYRFPV